MSDILAVVGAALDAHQGANDFPAGCTVPARRYVAHSEPAWDCDTLAVYWSPVDTSNPLRGRPTGGDCAVLGGVAVHIQLVLCDAPVENPAGQPGSAPSPAQWNTFTACLNAQAWAMWCAVADAAYTKTLYSEQEACEQVAIINMNPLGPQGGIAGVDMLLWIDLPCTT